MKWFNCWLFHKWGKWEQYEQEMVRVSRYSPYGNIEYILDMQKRKCDLCGKLQKIRVKD